jgi:UDP-glucose 4-epimerase
VPLQEARRAGDVVGAFANVDRAVELLGCSAELSLESAIDSALAWSRKRYKVLGYD